MIFKFLVKEIENECHHFVLVEFITSIFNSSIHEWHHVTFFYFCIFLKLLFTHLDYREKEKLEIPFIFTLNIYLKLCDVWCDSVTSSCGVYHNCHVIFWQKDMLNIFNHSLLYKEFPKYDPIEIWVLCTWLYYTKYHFPWLIFIGESRSIFPLKCHKGNHFSYYFLLFLTMSILNQESVTTLDIVHI